MKKLLISILFFGLVIPIAAQNGLVKTFYEKKKPESVISYTEDVLNGTSYWYFRNGNLKKEITYSAGKVNGWVKYYYETGLIKEEYRVVEGVRDGLCKFYYENGGLKEVRSYEGGKQIKRIEIDYDPTYIAPVEMFNAGNRQLESQKKEEYLCDADLCPEPIGGMDRIYSNLIYPEHARLYGLEGVVKLVVRIDTNGSVIKTEIVEGLGLGCQEAAIEAVKKTRFLPGRTNGKNVISNLILSINFKLDQPVQVAQNDQTPTFITDPETKVVKVEQNADANFKYNTSVEEFPEDKKTETKTVTETVKPANIPDCEIDVCPKPVGGMEKIYNRFKLPKRAKKNNDKGDIIILAEVDENGYVRNTEVLQDIGHGAGLAAEVAILDTKFEPGLLNGKPKRTKVKITITVN